LRIDAKLFSTLAIRDAKLFSTLAIRDARLFSTLAIRDTKLFSTLAIRDCVASDSIFTSRFVFSLDDSVTAGDASGSEGRLAASTGGFLQPSRSVSPSKQKASAFTRVPSLGDRGGVRGLWTLDWAAS